MNSVTAGFLASLLLCACGNNPQKGSDEIGVSDPQVIRITSVSPHRIRADRAKRIFPEELDGMLSWVDYIKLDSSEPIGNIDKMIVTEERIVIMDSYSAQQIFVFDREGKLLFRIKNKGQGPMEYTSVTDMQVDTLRHEIMLVDSWACSYLYFSIDDGKFLRREKGIANFYAARIDSLYVNFQIKGQHAADKEYWPILVTDKDSIVYKGFRPEPLQEGNYASNNFCHDSDGSLLYTPIHSDTIYRFSSPSAACAKYVICQKKSIWNRSGERLSEEEINNLIKKNGYTGFNGKFFATENHAAFTNIAVSGADQKYITVQPYFWDKRNDTVYVLDSEGDTGKRPQNMISYPTAVYGDTFVYAFSPAIVPAAMDKKGLNSKLKRVLDRSKADDNPIVVFYKFK